MLKKSEERKRKSKHNNHADSETGNVQNDLEAKYCQIVVHHSGRIEVHGDKKTVDKLVSRLENSSFVVKWSYRGPCG